MTRRQLLSAWCGVAFIGVITFDWHCTTFWCNLPWPIQCFQCLWWLCFLYMCTSACARSFTVLRYGGVLYCSQFPVFSSPPPSPFGLLVLILTFLHYMPCSVWWVLGGGLGGWGSWLGWRFHGFWGDQPTWVWGWKLQPPGPWAPNLHGHAGLYI